MHLLKVTKFLVKIYQFKFLVYFLCKNCTATPWKKSPPLSQQPSPKNWGPVKHHLLENLGCRFNFLPNQEGGGAHYV